MHVRDLLPIVVLLGISAYSQWSAKKRKEAEKRAGTPVGGAEPLEEDSENQFEEGEYEEYEEKPEPKVAPLPTSPASVVLRDLLEAAARAKPAQEEEVLSVFVASEKNAPAAAVQSIQKVVSSAESFGVAEHLADPESLRRAFILKTILDKPLTLQNRSTL